MAGDTWQQLAPRVWAERLAFDRARADRHQTADLAAVTETVLERARDGGAAAVVLSGSTARGRRSRLSDLDYHLIGLPSLRTADLPQDVLFDSGVMQEAATLRS